MNAVEKKLAEQIGALVLENVKLSTMVDDLRAQIAKLLAEKAEHQPTVN
jgi:cell division protein FtsB